jgi:hypothetical protein
MSEQKYHDKPCARCKRQIEIPTADGGTGYGRYRNPTTGDWEDICYNCCGEADKDTLRREEKVVFYLVKRGDRELVVNWPGSLEFIPTKIVHTKMGGFGERLLPVTLVWFEFEGHHYYGRQQGNNNELLRCRPLIGNRKRKNATQTPSQT